MALIRTILCLAAALAVASCGQAGGQGGGLLGAALSSLRAPKAPAVATADLPRAEIEAAGIPVKRLILKARATDVLIVQRDSRGSLATFVSSDATTYTFRNGILIETRGLGADLMSSSTPTPAQIVGGAGHSRVYVFPGPDETSERRTYICTVEDRGPASVVIFGKAYSTRHLAEVCQRPEGRITNDFWMQGSFVRKSRQWISPLAGYAEIERITD